MKLNDKLKGRVRLAADIAVSVSLFVSGGLFIWACYSIYKTGPSPFTRQSIAKAFSKIAVVVYVTISLVIVGVGVHIAMPKEEKKLVGARSAQTLVDKLSTKVDITTVSEELNVKITKERKLRTILSWVRIALLALSASLPLIYLLNPANFPAISGEYNAEILHGMLVYLAMLAPLTVFEIVRILLVDASLMREHEALKEAVKENGISKFEEPISVFGRVKGFFENNKKPITLGVRIAFVVCAIGFIIAGIFNGGMTDVLNKAIKICTECIGLG